MTSEVIAQSVGNTQALALAPAPAETLLNDLWSFYFHDPFNTDWNFSSYIKIDDISSVESYWTYHETFRERIPLGMFFLMREHVFPAWDDTYNKDGGCLSIKVLKQDMNVFWETICIRLLGETLLKEDKRKTLWDHVNGCSSSCKRHFCIIKVWLKSPIDLEHFNIPPGYYGEIIYKPNSDSIGT